MSDSKQGGANGNGVYVEVSLPIVEEHMHSTFQLLVHEAFHRIIDPSQTFDVWSDVLPEDKVYPHIEEGNQPLNAYLEELVIRTISDVYTFGKDPQGIYEDSADAGAKHSQAWGHTVQFAPILVAYLEGKQSVAETKQLIAQFAQQIVEAR